MKIDRKASEKFKLTRDIKLLRKELVENKSILEKLGIIGTLFLGCSVVFMCEAFTAGQSSVDKIGLLNFILGLLNGAGFAISSVAFTDKLREYIELKNEKENLEELRDKDLYLECIVEELSEMLASNPKRFDMELENRKENLEKNWYLDDSFEDNQAILLKRKK